MKRHISIFAFLLSALAVAEPARAFDFWVCSTAECKVRKLEYGPVETFVSFDTFDSERGAYYPSSSTGSDYHVVRLKVGEGATDIDRVWAQDVTDMRFVGWYGLAKNSTAGTAPAVTEATVLLTNKKELTYGDITQAKTWNPGGDNECPFVVAKYVRVYTITTSVEPIKTGTVSLDPAPADGKYEEGSKVMLTADPTSERSDSGYHFVRWNDGETDATRTIEKLSANVSLIAEFTANGYGVTKVDENAVIVVDSTGTYDQDLSVSWSSENADGYTYEFVSAKILAGDETLTNFTTGTSGVFNMKADVGKYSSSVTVEVKYTKTPVVTGYQLTIDPNGGKFKGMEDNYTFPDRLQYGEKTLSQIDVATDGPGVFLGYFTSNGQPVYNAEGKNIKCDYWTASWPDGTFQGAAGLRLEARWGEALQIDVTAEPSAAGQVTGGGYYLEGTGVTLEAVVTNAGYSFCCWTNSATGLFSNDNPWTFTVTADATYTAVFTGNVYRVTFDGQRFFKDLKTKQVSYGQPYGDEPEGFVMDGYKIEGWYTLPYGKGVKKDLAGNVDTPADHTLYANWTEKTESTGTFVDPSGTNKTVVVEGLTKGQSVPVDKTPKFTRGGYWFDRWEPSLPDKVTGDFTTYAQWLSIASVLDYEGTLWFSVEDNSAWVVDSEDFKQGGTSLKADGPRKGGSGLLTTSVSKPGTMTFWWKGDTGTTLSVKSEKDEFFGTFDGTNDMDWTSCTITVDRAASVIFYCSETEFGGRCSVDGFTWTPDDVPQKRTITVDAGEHGSATGGGAFDIGENVTLTATAEDGYAFCCWTNETGVVTNENPWAFKVVEDATYTATFTACVYRVTLNASGGTGGETEVWATFGEEMPTLKNLPQLEHNTFLGYFDAATDGNQYYNADGTSAATWNKTADSELFAHWNEEGKVAVTVTSSDTTRGTVSGGGSYYPDEEVTISAMRNVGYAFCCWTNDTGFATNANPWTFKVTASATYTATFTACVYRVMFDANDGETPSPQTKDVTFGELYGALATTTRSGYNFAGWWTEQSGGTEVEETTTVTITADQTLYAQWKKITVVDPIAQALDCANAGLTFTATGGWSVFTNAVFAYESGNDQCLTNKATGARLTTKISQSGTLTFGWKAPFKSNLNFLVLTNEALATQCKMKSQDETAWRFVSLNIAVPRGEEVELVFLAQNPGTYTALDYFTWTPEGKEPAYAETDTPVTGFSMADGKLGFSFAGDGSTYHLLGTNDLVAPMPWPMVFETNKASGPILFDIPVKADEPKMFYRIRALKP